MNQLYLECPDGVSGSALLGALVDLGCDGNLLLREAKCAVPGNFKLTFTRTAVSGLAATRVDLETAASDEPVSVSAFIDRLKSSGRAGRRVVAGLDKLFGKYVGAISRILNIPAAEVKISERDLHRAAVIAAGYFAALEQLGLERIVAAPLPVGMRTSALADGSSAPFILELARGLRVSQAAAAASNTPLGVALLAASASEFGALPEMTVDSVGYGALKTDGGASLLRAITGTGHGQSARHGDTETVMVLETVIDDMNPELFPHLVDRLMSGGALDAFLTPVQMKKGRPGCLLTALCRSEALEQVLAAIFFESTTLGVRLREEKRRVLRRSFFKVNTPYGRVTVKAGHYGESGEVVQLAPEYEDCQKVAARKGVPLKEVYAEALLAARREQKDRP